MHTRKRALAGVTAGALALSVLALSPVTPASAELFEVPDNALPGVPAVASTAYMAGSTAIIERDELGTVLSELYEDPIDVRNPATLAAKVTSNAEVGVFGRLFVPNVELPGDPATPIGLYDCDSDWSDVEPTGTNTTASGVFAFGPDWRKVQPIWADADNPCAFDFDFGIDGPGDGAAPYQMPELPWEDWCEEEQQDLAGMDVAPYEDQCWLAIHSPGASEVTVETWLDDDADGQVDGGERPSVKTFTLKFVTPKDVTVDIPTEAVLQTPRQGGAQARNSTQVYSNLGFTAIPMVGTLPLRQSDLLPGNEIGIVEGPPRWTSGSFASLNGRPAIAAQDFAPADPFTDPYEPTPFGVIYAANTGKIVVTGWFDPTGAVPPADRWAPAPSPWAPGDWEDDSKFTNNGVLAPTRAPITPPTGFVASQKTVTVGSTQLSQSSTMTASGTGVVADGPFEYSVPLSTLSVTFELTANKVNPLRPTTEAAQPYPAGTPVEVLLTGDYRAAANTGPETFSANGLAIDKATLFGAGVVVKGVTDANGKFQVLLTVTGAGLQPSVTDLMAINALLVKVNGQPAPMFQYPTPFCDDDLGFSVALPPAFLSLPEYAEYFADFLCDSGNLANSEAALLAEFKAYTASLVTATAITAAQKEALDEAFEVLVIPELPGFRYNGPTGVNTTAVWNKVGRVSNWNTTGSLDGVPFGGGGQFYNSVVSNSTSSMTVNLKDTFGNIIPGRTVGLVGNPALPSLIGSGGTTGANGSVTFGIPGLASGYRLLQLFDTDDQLAPVNLIAQGAILYQPIEQMTAGGISTPRRQRALVSEADEFPFWQPVTFRVINSVGDPMAGVVGIVSTTNGVVAQAPGPDIDDEIAISGNVVLPDGSLTVWVASRTVGKASITLSIGGKTATAIVDFVNRYQTASSLVIAGKGGGPVPTSVAPRSRTKMRVTALDANGNRLEAAYVMVKVKGDARHRSGGRQRQVFTGKNGVGAFRVQAHREGSFRVVAVTDRFTPTLAWNDLGWWTFYSGDEDIDPSESGRKIRARTGEIQIKKAKS